MTEESQLARKGEAISFTDEEYGVRKDDGIGVVKPINSAGGLLFLAILISLSCGVSAVIGIGLLIDNKVTDWVQLIIAFAVVLFLVPTSWAYYLKERRAVRLRRASGKTLGHPTRRSTVRD